MFERERSYNKLPMLPPKFDFDDVDILKKVNKANMALSRLDGSSLSIPNRVLLIEPLSVREAVASSGIENINTTVAEVFKAEILPKKEITKEQKETLHYKDALKAGLVIIEGKKILHTNAFLQIQSVLEPSNSGIRKLPGTKIVNSSSKVVVYTPPDGETLIRDLLKDLENYLNQDHEDVDALIQVAILHYQFEAIHPFNDGNGRTGRILIVLYLILKKRLQLPILFISGYINKHRSEYYRLLQGVTEKGEWKAWIMFMLDAIETQAIETSETVLKIKEMQESYKATIKSKLPKIYSGELVEYLFANPFYSHSQLASRMNMHPNTAAKYLNSLLENKILESSILKKEKIYYNPKLLKLLE